MGVLARAVGLASAFESPSEADGRAAVLRDVSASRSSSDHESDVDEGRGREAADKCAVSIVVGLVHTAGLLTRGSTRTGTRSSALRSGCVDEGIPGSRQGREAIGSKGSHLSAHFLEVRDISSITRTDIRKEVHVGKVRLLHVEEDSVDEIHTKRRVTCSLEDAVKARRDFEHSREEADGERMSRTMKHVYKNRPPVQLLSSDVRVGREPDF